MSEKKLTRFDAAEFLEDEETTIHFLDDAFETGDPAYIAAALGVVARARNMSRLAEEAGMSRTWLYKALSGDGNPEFGTILKVAKALGYRLRVEPERDEAA